MIRFLLLNAFIFVHSVLFCTWGLVLGLGDRDGRKVHFLCAVPWAKVILWVCGIRVTAMGQENLDRDVPRIYMTNHQSYFDIFGLLARLPLHFKFIVKQELMKTPLLGPTMRRAGYIGLSRDDPRKAIQSIQEAAEKIKAGASVVIFPEGTRSKDGTLLPFKKGGFNLALKAGCDIVPVGIRGSYKIVPKGSLRIRKGSFDITIGRPISVKGHSKRTVQVLMKEVRQAMLQLTASPADPQDQFQSSMTS